MSPGELIKPARNRHNLSRGQLALRAGTRQPAISRLERDDIPPSVETLETLLRVMGEELELSSRPAGRSYDPLHRKRMSGLTPEQRLGQAISWNRLAGKFAAAGRHAGNRP